MESDDCHSEQCKRKLQNGCALNCCVAFLAVLSASAGGWRFIFAAGTSEDLCSNGTKLHPEGKELFHEVCLGGGTEAPHTGIYDYDKEDIPTTGVYRCACCGAPLFPVSTQFNSGTGWPSFWAPVEGSVAYGKDVRQMLSIEISCDTCGAHLGHVFDDGVGETGYRYCINSVCLHHDAAAEWQALAGAPWLPNFYLLLALAIGGIGGACMLACRAPACVSSLRKRMRDEAVSPAPGGRSQSPRAPGSVRGSP